MPPPPLMDIGTLDFARVIADRAEVERCIPHRFEFGLLDAVIHVDHEAGLYAGYHDLRPDAWWARGHIPGRPLFPGVLMIEIGAQLASYIGRLLLPSIEFIGFAGVDDVKFRDAVVPPARFLIVGRSLEVRMRRVVCKTQGFVDRTMVFEGTITGMPV